MLEQAVTKEAVILKLNDLPPDGLVEVARFIDFLFFKTGNKSRTSRTRRVSTPLSASGLIVLKHKIRCDSLST